MKDVKSPTGQRISGNWKQFVGKIKETWGELTNDDLDKFEGRMDQLEGHIEEKTGEKRADIKKKIGDIADSAKDFV